VKNFGYGAGTAPLTPTELARLRRSVDPSALERWLSVSGGELRRAIIAHFAETITEDDLRVTRAECGASAEEMAELELMLAEPPPPPEPMRYPAADAPEGAVAFQFIPTSQLVLFVEPPEDPALRALWDAIEPARQPG
jgi:hypothetical protein